jgi:hypothetical protein
MKVKTTMMMVAAAAILTAVTARADDWWSDHFYYDTTHAKQTFNGNELSFDMFASDICTRRGDSWTGSFDHGKWGGGIGANYFFIPFLGIDAETSAQCGSQRFIDHVGGNVIARLPIEPIHLAPYIFGGGGRAFNPDWNWYWDGGAGLEFRLNPKLGLFSDGRYVWKDRGAESQVQLRAGVRLVF